MISIERVNHEKDYKVILGYRQIEYNTLNNYPWFLLIFSYSNGMTTFSDIYVKKDAQWYYRNVSENNGRSSQTFFSPRKPQQAVLDVYDELIKKEIKNFTYNSILIQNMLIPDVMNYIKTFF